MGAGIGIHFRMHVLSPTSIHLLLVEYILYLNHEYMLEKVFQQYILYFIAVKVLTDLG